MSINRLTWGVKASFRSYVEAAGGTINMSDGATRTEDGSLSRAVQNYIILTLPNSGFEGYARANVIGSERSIVTTPSCSRSWR